MIINFFRAIVDNEKQSYYPFSIFLVSIFFWYLFFPMLNVKKSIFLGASLTFAIYSFLRIIKKIPHRQIPEHYSERAKTTIRIFIFISMLGFLLYHINHYKLFDM